jgi:hypothetical protein
LGLKIFPIRFLVTDYVDLQNTFQILDTPDFLGGHIHFFPIFLPRHRAYHVWCQKSSSSDVRNEEQIEKPLVALKEREVNVCLLAVPHAEEWGTPQYGWIRRISTDLGIPILEPGVELAKRTEILHFTDGAHLDVASAKQIVAETVKNLRE